MLTDFFMYAVYLLEAYFSVQIQVYCISAVT